MGTRNLAEASLDELYEMGGELRKELAAIPEENRTDEEDHRVRALCDEANELDTRITLVEMEDRRAKHALASTMGGIRGDITDTRSLGEIVVTQDLVDWAAKTHGVRYGEHSGDHWDMSIEQLGSAAQLFTRSDAGLMLRAMGEWGSGGPPGYSSSGMDPSQAAALLPVGQPIAPIPRQARLYLRDLIPVMTTTLAQIPYVQELNPTNNESATAVAEGGNKPNAALNFQGAKADPTVLAATLVISKQLFEDAAAVVQYINNRLPYLVKFKEDQEFLNGSGTWPDIQGILNTPGILSQGLDADNATTFGAAFAQVENQDGTPTAVVLNPKNAWKMFTQRAAGGSGTFDAGTPFSALPLTVWGVPTYRTRAMALDSALVGDFQLGAMIADREQVNIETYRERYAEQNQIFLVCEERVGLMVFRPDLFVNVTGLQHLS